MARLLPTVFADDEYYEDDEEDDPDALKDPLYQVDLQVQAPPNATLTAGLEQ